MLENLHKLPISELGEFKLIDHLTQYIELKNKSSILGIGDDAAVIKYDNDKLTLVSCDLLIEGVHFNLTYTPLKHLGYKAAVVNFSDIYAMNGTPRQIVVGIAVSSRFTVDALEELYAGIMLACEKYNVDFVGGDTTASPRGLQISVTAIGEVEPERLVKRHTSKEHDLICVTGDLGGAYAGLLVLQREEKTFLANPNYQPDLEPYSYVVERQLKPEARKEIIELFKQHDIIPTSMIDVSDGLASELFHLCKKNGCGLKIYEDKIPVDIKTEEVGEEFSISALTMALNGGEDYELLFTIDMKDLDKIRKIPDVAIIGHITAVGTGKYFISNIGQEIELKAQGWDAFKK